MSLVHVAHLIIVIIYYSYGYSSTVLLNAQEVYDFIEKIEFDLFHRETCTKCVNDGFTATFGEVNFGAETEAFLGDEYSRIMRAFFENAKSAVIIELVEAITFAETVVCEGIGNLARWT